MLNVKIVTPLVLAFTPNYFVPMATFMLSLLEHSKSTDKYHIVCLLTEDLPQEMQKELRLLGGERLAISYMNLDGCLKDIYVDERYTVAASFRLLLPDLLPEYDKVLYMDCDIIVRNNMAELFHSIDLGANYLAAVFEAVLGFQEAHIRALGCDPQFYINSGVLIMNLKQLRKDKMVSKFIEASKAKGLEFPDQDVLNQLCKGRVLGLPPYYNSIRTFCLTQYKSTFLNRYKEDDWVAVQKHGNIHYTGSKPWNSFTVKFEVWWKYYERLPKSIKRMRQVSNKYYSFFKFYNTFLGKTIVNLTRSMYRIVKG